MQKNYTVDFLTKKYKKNEGELPQYYVSNDQEGIIDRATFDYVQVELKKRLEINKQGIYNCVASRYSGINIFSGKIVCEECGAFFGRKVWHSNDKYRKIVYRCNRKYDDESAEIAKLTTTDKDKKDKLNIGENTKNDKIATIGKDDKGILGKGAKLTTTDKIATINKGTKDNITNHVCTTGIITEDEIKKLFIEEYNKLDKTKAIRNAKRLIKELTDTTELEAQMEKERKMALDYKEKIDVLVDKNSRVAMDQVLYNKKKESLNLQYEKYCEKTHSIQTKIYERKDRLVQLENFIKHIKDYAITTFDEGLFCALVDKIIVYKDKAEIRWRGEIL